MRIVVDTNIVFSAILNTNSRIAQILITSKSSFNFYSTELLLNEIIEHKSKLKHLTDYTDSELNKIISLVIGKIRFVNVELIPKEILEAAEKLTKDIDEDDAEFIGLTEHIRGKIWSGDKELIKGLAKKHWNKFVSTEQLFKKLTRKS